jgi:FAD/FMN-containing dehydrogenase
MKSQAEALTSIVGSGNLSQDPATLEAFSGDQSFADRLKPHFVVKVETASQVQALVRWANSTLTPLVPVSSGPPHFRGDTVPSSPGAVIVDLSGMRRIVHVDPRNRMAIIEPGVTYAQLQSELAKHGLTLSSPLAPRANKSVLGALLEREPITAPRFQWAMLDPLRCTEVVWGDGQRMTTGEAESTEALEKEWAKKWAQVNPNGPAQTNFYKFTSAAQGSMGIVTWASVKCELLPQVHKLFFAPAEDLWKLLDLTYSILRIRFADELLILNSRALAMLLEKDRGLISKRAEAIPRWILLIGIAGRERLPEKRVACQAEDISEMAQRFGLRLQLAVPGAKGAEALEAILNWNGDQNGNHYWKTSYKGGCQELFFLNTLDKSPIFVEAIGRLAENHRHPASQIGIYIQPVQQGASCHIEFELSYDCFDRQETSGMKHFFLHASEEMLRLGAYYSRPYGVWASMAFNRDAQSTMVLKRSRGSLIPTTSSTRANCVFKFRIPNFERGAVQWP